MVFDEYLGSPLFSTVHHIEGLQFLKLTPTANVYEAFVVSFS